MGAKIEKLKIQTEKSDFWSDNEKAKNILKEKNRLDTLFSKFSNLSNELDDLKILKNLFKHDDDVKSNRELFDSIQKFKTSLNDLRLQTLFSGEADNNDCFLEINAGAGGTESQDWAEMLIRMYNRWIDNKSFKDENELNKHIDLITKEDQITNDNSRTLELKNWLDHIKKS